MYKNNSGSCVSNHTACFSIIDTVQPGRGACLSKQHTECICHLPDLSCQKSQDRNTDFSLGENLESVHPSVSAPRNAVMIVIICSFPK